MIRISLDKDVQITFDDYNREFLFDFQNKGVSQRIVRIPIRFIVDFQKLAYSELDTIMNREAANK